MSGAIKIPMTVTMFDHMPKVAPTSALGVVASFQILRSVFLPLTKLLVLTDALADNSLGLILANLDCLCHLDSVFFADIDHTIQYHLVKRSTSANKSFLKKKASLMKPECR